MGLAVNQERKPRWFKSIRPHHHVGVPEWTKGPACKAGCQGFKSPHRLDAVTLIAYALVAQSGQSSWLRTRESRVQILPSARLGVWSNRRRRRSPTPDDEGSSPSAPANLAHVAQVDRASACGAEGRRFESSRVRHRCRLAQTARAPARHAGGPGFESQSDNTRAGQQQAWSRPGGIGAEMVLPALDGVRLLGSDLHRLAQLVERCVYTAEAPGSTPGAMTNQGDVAQLDRAPALQAGGHGFDSRLLHMCSLPASRGSRLGRRSGKAGASR